MGRQGCSTAKIEAPDAKNERPGSAVQIAGGKGMD
jgi:hypothetical protein